KRSRRVHQWFSWSHPRKSAQASHSYHLILICSNQLVLFQKYALNLCYPCFCQHTKD
ncbi:unnamed protein product, partial [Gulo gulo]